MKVSRRWIEWAHRPGAEDGQPLAMSLCDLASAPGAGSIEVSDLALITELVDVCPALINSHTQIGRNQLVNKRDESKTRSL